jgi:sn-glycerol 3-phosphate transport system substrate-binding protein
VRGRGPAAAALALATVLVVACSDPPTTGSGAAPPGEDASLPDCPVDALDKAERPVEIELWYGGLGGETQQTMEDIVAGFNRSQHDVVVRASDQGAAYQEVDRAFESAATAGGDQLPDIVYLEDIELASVVDSGLVLPAQACMQAAGYDPTQLEPAARAEYTVGGVLYPGYMNVSTPILYYNKAHFQKAGLDPEKPPATLDEVYEAAKALKAKGVTPKPFALKTDRWWLESWLTGAGVDIVNHDNGRDGAATEATFAGRHGDEVLSFLQKMNDEGLLNPFANTEGGYNDFLALVNGQSSMVIGTSTAATTIRAALSGQINPDDVGADVDPSVLDSHAIVPGSGPFPGLEAGGKALTSGGAFYMLNTSDPGQQAAAWRFLSYMLRPDVAQRWHLQGSYLPVVKAVEDQPAVRRFQSDDVAGILLRPAIEQFDDTDPDRPGPLIGPYPDEVAALEAAMGGVLFARRDPPAELSQAQRDVTASLERYQG